MISLVTVKVVLWGMLLVDLFGMVVIITIIGQYASRRRQYESRQIRRRKNEQRARSQQAMYGYSAQCTPSRYNVTAEFERLTTTPLAVDVPKLVPGRQDQVGQKD